MNNTNLFLFPNYEITQLYLKYFKDEILYLTLSRYRACIIKEFALDYHLQSVIVKQTEDPNDQVEFVAVKLTNHTLIVYQAIAGMSLILTYKKPQPMMV